MRSACRCASTSGRASRTTWRLPAIWCAVCALGKSLPTAPMMPTAYTTSSWNKAANRSSAPPPSQISAPLRPHRLQTTMGHRRLLRQTQTMATHRHALRQARLQLPRLHQTRQHHALAQIVKSSLHPRAFSSQVESPDDSENAENKKESRALNDST